MTTDIPDWAIAIKSNTGWGMFFEDAVFSEHEGLAIIAIRPEKIKDLFPAMIKTLTEQTKLETNSRVTEVTFRLLKERQDAQDDDTESGPSECGSPS